MRLNFQGGYGYILLPLIVLAAHEHNSWKLAQDPKVASAWTHNVIALQYLIYTWDKDTYNPSVNDISLKL